MAIFGAQGIRDAMLKSYQKHSTTALGNFPAGTTPHQAGLYGALGTRYISGGRPAPEVVVWAEVTPFLNLPSSEGSAALAEYVVYKEMPTQANVSMLTAAVKKGWALFDDDSKEGMKMMAQMNHLAWLGLI